MAGAIGAGTKKTARKAAWIVLAVLTVAAIVAVQTGWMGFGWAQLKSRFLPRDEALLEWVPGDSSMVVVVDPHQLKLAALGPEQGSVRTAIERVRNDIKKATDIDLARDVDKMVITSSLLVARGRFDADDLQKRLAEYRYVKLEHGGKPYLARAGEDAIAVIDDEILLYGDEPTIKASIDAEAGDTSIAKNEKFRERLRRLGWDRAVLGTVQVTDERPSLRKIVTGSTGPRAISFGARSQAGLDLEAHVEAASPSAAEELAKLLEERKANADKALVEPLGDELSKLLAEVVKSAAIKTDSAAGVVTLTTHVPQETLDASLAALDKSAPVADVYKTLRLFQLLAPIP